MKPIPKQTGDDESDRRQSRQNEIKQTLAGTVKSISVFHSFPGINSFQVFITFTKSVKVSDRGKFYNGVISFIDPY